MTTWTELLSECKTDDDRSRLGRNCPSGVEGATWAARLALQLTDYERSRLGGNCPAGVEGRP